MSRVTLEYVGFSEEKSNELWESWSKEAPGSPSRGADDVGIQTALFNFLTGYFNLDFDPFSEDDRCWRMVMDKFGLNSAAQEFILDPALKFVRRHKSCVYWARDMVEMRHSELQEIQRTSRERSGDL